MLILSRKPGESIEIGEATVTVLGIERGQVRIGVAAPPHIPVDRTEIYERKRAGLEPPGVRRGWNRCVGLVSLLRCSLRTNHAGPCEVRS